MFENSICSMIPHEDTIHVQRIVTPTEHVSYVFSGKNNSPIEHATFKSKHTSQVHLINSSIYKDDTIHAIRIKIANAMTTKKTMVSPNDLHLFSRKAIHNPTELTFAYQKFVNHYFKSVSEKTVSNFNQLFQVFFEMNRPFDPLYPIPWKKDSELIHKQDAMQMLANVSNKPKHYMVPLSFKVYDLERYSTVFATNPFDGMLNDTAVLKKGASVDMVYFDMNDLGSFETGDLTEIFVVHKDDLVAYCKNSGDVALEQNQTYLEELYFEREFQHTPEHTELQSRIDTIKENVNSYDFEKNVRNITCKVTDIRIVSHLEYVHPQDLVAIFNTMTASKHAPFITFKNRLGVRLYRVLKQRVHDVISEKQLHEWIEAEKIVKSVKRNQIDVRLFFGSMQVRYTVNEEGAFHADIQFPTSSYAFEEVQSCLQKINGWLKSNGLTEIKIGKNAKLHDMKTNVTLTTETGIMTDHSGFLKNIEKSIFFSKIKEHDAKNMITFKYKRVSNYANLDEIETFINMCIEKKQGKVDIIQSIANEFSMETTDAQKRYTLFVNKFDLTNLPQHAKRKRFNTGVIITMKIKELQISFSISKLDRIDYHENIVKSLIVTIMSADQRDLQLKPRMQKLAEANMDAFHASSQPSQESASDDDDSITMDDLFDDDDEIDNMFGLFGTGTDTGTGTGDDVDNEADPATVPQAEPVKVDVKAYQNLENDKSKYNAYIKDHVINALQKADKELFSSEGGKYTTSCQAVAKRQPIVISKAEKDHIDNTSPNSYYGYVKTGSTPEKLEKNFYICPLVWCPISRVSIPYETYLENKGKESTGQFACPMKETPLLLMKKDEVEKYKPGQRKTPHLLKDEKLAKNSNYPVCCTSVLNESKQKEGVIFDGKDSHISFDDDMQETSNTEKYVCKIGKFPDKDRFATLPKQLNQFLNGDRKCEGVLANCDQCFLRRGLGFSVKDKFLNALMLTLQLPQINTVSDLKSHIERNLQTHEFIQLNAGQTMKAYAPKDNSALFSESKYIKFKKRFLKNTSYIAYMNMGDTVKKYVHDDVLLSDPVSEESMLVRREMIIYASKRNFIKYIKDNTIETEYEDVIDMLRFQWMNPLQINYIIMDITHAEKPMILCRKYNESEHFDNKVNILLKTNDIYEHLIKYTKADKQNIYKPFSVNNDHVREIVKVYHANCNSLSNGVAKRVFGALKTEYPEEEIDGVLNYNYKITGFFLPRIRLYCPLPVEAGSVYGIGGLRYLDTVTGIEHSRLPKTLVPIDAWYATLTDISIDRSILQDDLMIFVGYWEMTQSETTYQEAYNTVLRAFLSTLTDAPDVVQRLRLIRHELNPFSLENKMKDIENVVRSVDADVPDAHMQRIKEDIYNIGLDHMEHAVNSTITVDHEMEDVYSWNDLRSDHILKTYMSSKNHYKNIKSTIEDAVQFVDVEPSMVKTTDTQDRMSASKSLPRTQIYEDSNVYNKMYHQRVMMIDLPFPTVFTMLTKEFDLKRFTKMMVQALRVAIETKGVSLTNVRRIMNLYGQNKVVSKATNTTRHTPPEIELNSHHDLDSMYANPLYQWGILELYMFSKKYNLGLIFTSKKKKNVDEDMLPFPENNTIILRESASNTYMLVYINKTMSQRMKILSQTNSSDSHYNELMFTLSKEDHPQLFANEPNLEKIDLIKNVIKVI